MNNKYYYIDKYINYYKNNALIYSDRATRETLPTLEQAKEILKNKQPKKIENKKYISVYEEYKLIYRENKTYKCLYNEISPEGVIKNV